MRSPSNFSRTAPLLALALVMTVMPAARSFADTYSLSAVAFTQSENFFAGDDYGNYTINLASHAALCVGSSPGGPCFQTHYINSPHDLFTTIPPPLWTDPSPIAGSDPCAVASGSGFSVLRILCNNGHMIFSGYYSGPGIAPGRGIWAGSNPDPVSSYLGRGSIDGGFMTANGNAFFIDGYNNTLDVALDLSTSPIPEPGSLVLLGTGALSLLGVARRKIRGRI